MDQAPRFLSEKRLETGELSLFVVEEREPIGPKMLDHSDQVRVKVLNFKSTFVFLKLVRCTVEESLFPKTQLLGPDPLDRERPTYADHCFHYFWLIHQLLWFRVGSNAGV